MNVKLETLIILYIYISKRIRYNIKIMITVKHID